MRVLVVILALVALALCLRGGGTLKKVLRRTTILLLLGLICWAVWWLAQFYVVIKAEREGRLFYLPAFALTTDRTPVDFTIRDRRFRVPKAYLEFKSEWAGGKVDALFLQALLPDMDPPSDANLEEFENPGWQNQVLITIEDAKNWRELEDVDRWFLGETVADTKIELPEYALVRYDFASRTRGEQLFIPINNHPQIRYFTCGVADEFVKSPSCDVFFYWDRKIHIHYIFSKEYLPRWQNVNDSVMHLVNLLMVREYIEP